MKNKKIYLMVGLLWLLGLSAYARGGQIASGGGGIYKYGRPVTFGTANFYTSETSLSLSDLPELSNLINFFVTTPYVSAETKAAYLKALVPTRNRNYYQVRENTFTKEVSDRLIESYMRALKIDKNERKNIRIFAVTDTNRDETYLLPDFYQLNSIEKQAILFHEAMWVRFPNASYRLIIDAEIKFQRYLEAKIPDRLMSWIEAMGDDADRLVAAVRSDLEHGYLNKLMPDGKLRFASLFGADWLSCHAAGRMHGCYPLIKNNIVAWSMNPEVGKSALINLLMSANLITINSTGFIRDLQDYSAEAISKGLSSRKEDEELGINHPFYSSALVFEGLYYQRKADNSGGLKINLDYKDAWRLGRRAYLIIEF